jgi:hypothetical protein
MIYNNLKCCPGKFLMEVCPLKKPSKSLDPKDLGGNFKAEIAQKTAQYHPMIQ